MAQTAKHTPEVPLARRLRETTRLMASRITAPQGLWNEHSNACLQAADTIDQFEVFNAELLTALAELLTALKAFLLDLSHFVEGQERELIAEFLKRRNQARRVIKKVEGR